MKFQIMMAFATCALVSVGFNVFAPSPGSYVATIIFSLMTLRMLPAAADDIERFSKKQEALRAARRGKP